ERRTHRAAAALRGPARRHPRRYGRTIGQGAALHTGGGASRQPRAGGPQRGERGDAARYRRHRCHGSRRGAGRRGDGDLDPELAGAAGRQGRTDHGAGGVRSRVPPPAPVRRHGGGVAPQRLLRRGRRRRAARPVRHRRRRTAQHRVPARLPDRAGHDAGRSSM
ncbi:MAG: hypothetical protein AVDCRST_MAG66-1660, partial [uncultured Pseudonocardia sp.]